MIRPAGLGFGWMIPFTFGAAFGNPSRAYMVATGVIAMAVFVWCAIRDSKRNP